MGVRHPEIFETESAFKCGDLHAMNINDLDDVQSSPSPPPAAVILREEDPRVGRAIVCMRPQKIFADRITRHFRQDFLSPPSFASSSSFLSLSLSLCLYLPVYLSLSPFRCS